MNIKEKYKMLKERIASLEKAAVAFSGGVDSSFLSKVCFDMLGKNTAAVTIISSMNPQREIEEAKEIARFIGIPHYLIEDDTVTPDVAENSADRCYFCKKIEFSKIKEKAAGLGIGTVLDGSNIDDLADYRPGLRALKELGIISPLREAGLTKEEIRGLSKKLGLKTWNKPAYACLASRVPYGERITEEVLVRIEKAEEYIRELGFRQFRVRSHGGIARIEVSPEERKKMFNIRLLDKISGTLKTFGFVYVAMELEGYRTGSMNRALKAAGKRI